MHLIEGLGKDFGIPMGKKNINKTDHWKRFVRSGTDGKKKGNIPKASMVGGKGVFTRKILSTTNLGNESNKRTIVSVRARRHFHFER